MSIKLAKKILFVTLIAGFLLLVNTVVFSTPNQKVHACTGKYSSDQSSNHLCTQSGACCKCNFYTEDGDSFWWCEEGTCPERDYNGGAHDWCGSGGDDSGGNPSCATSDPSAPTLLSPPDNATGLLATGVPLSWTASSDWGEGCPTRNRYDVDLQPNCNGSFIERITDITSTEATLSGLAWDTLYCWRVSADNGSNTNDSPVRRFRTARPPEITSAGVIPATDICGGAATGSTRHPGVSNPIIVRIEGSDQDIASRDRIYIAFGLVQNSVTTLQHVNGSSFINYLNNEAIVAGAVDLTNNEVMVLSTTGAWIPATGINQITPQGTAEILDIGGATNWEINGTDLFAEIQVRIDDSHLNDNFRIYAAVIAELPGGFVVSSNPNSTDNIRYTRFQPWTIDTTDPDPIISAPSYNQDGTFELDWSVTDNLTGILGVNTDVYTDIAGTELIDFTIPTTFSFPDSGPANSQSAQITTSNLGTHTYLDTYRLESTFNFGFEAQDVACNVRRIERTVPHAGFKFPWITVAKNTASVRDGISNLGIPSTDLDIPEIGLFGNATFLDNIAITGGSSIATGQISRLSQFTTGYEDTAIDYVSDFEEESNWYEHLLDNLERNNDSNPDPIPIRRITSDIEINGSIVTPGEGGVLPPPPSQSSVCGDGVCEAPETAGTCLADCESATCGNNFCDGQDDLLGGCADECLVTTPETGAPGVIPEPEQGLVQGVSKEREGRVLQAVVGGSFVGVANEKQAFIVNGNMRIVSGSECNAKGIIFVSGNLEVEPDFTNTPENGCVFIVQGDIIIEGGQQKTNAANTDTSLAGYDILEGFFLADGTIVTSADYPDPLAKGDGLYIKGSLIGNRLGLGRDINRVGNTFQPAMYVEYDAQYVIRFIGDLANRKFSIREIL